MAGKAVPSPSIPLMFIRPWTLSFFYSGHCNLESCNKCPLFGEVWSCTDRTGCKMDRGWKTCVHYREAAYVQTWFMLSIFLGNFSSRVYVWVCPHVYSVWVVCLQDFIKWTHFWCQLCCSQLEELLWQPVQSFLIIPFPLDLQGAAKIRSHSKSWMT